MQDGEWNWYSDQIECLNIFGRVHLIAWQRSNYTKILEINDVIKIKLIFRCLLCCDIKQHELSSLTKKY